MGRYLGEGQKESPKKKKRRVDKTESKKEKERKEKRGRGRKIRKWVTQPVTAAGRQAGNTWLNFVQPGLNPDGTWAGLLRQPDSLR